MPAGLEIYNAAGQPIVSITDRVGRFLGSYNVSAGSSGSFPVPEFGQGSPFVVSVSISGDGNPAFASVSGNTVYWQFYYNAAYESNADTTIYYGVY
jgi:hypothetical protein